VDWKLYAWIKRGKRRKELLQLLCSSKQPLTAKEIKDKLKISLSQASYLLHELSKKNIIVCLNPDDKIGRLYSINEDYKILIGEIK
jgi:DNA-binding transcriptional regulator GbsR (MarR family)